MQALEPSPARPRKTLRSVAQTASRSDTATLTNQAWSRADALIENVEFLLWETAEDAGELLAAAHHQLTSGGKRFRARLTLALAAACGARVSESVTVAAACELLHNASLVHDDLQDRDEWRRDQPTIWKRYGDDFALLLGDWLHTRAYSLLTSQSVGKRHKATLAMRFFDATQAMIEGQAQECAFDSRTTFGDYEQAALGKSGSLLALAAESAFIIGNRTDQEIALAGQALAKIGIAYQMLDDLKDVRGEKEGRAAGSDLARGRLTAPTIAHLRSLDRSPAELPTLMAVRRNRHAIEAVEAAIHAHLQAATDLALGLPTPAAEVITNGLAYLFPARIGPGRGHQVMPDLRCVS